ncbi:MAG: phage tail protein [endosymbiont of Seepiophila jonesi]|uniref:Phage tail protein n=1 Tax=endosymbiont of Lamellibrachia luymesi TaxID=2200907 RepID=A0A370DZ39_9GAMM|nr:MAG: phage tail protein [endosymbiont of Lamellibrachia luymesi]RDH92081.1 MAG: phage tail protein [endosymbiont of Seepiophila jonesi]
MRYRTKDGDMLDAICWKYYSQQAGAVEIVLEANPGLADIGAVLSAGILIELPELPEPNQIITTVRLWD